MSKAGSAADRHFRDEAVERELLAYLLRKDPGPAKKVKPEWFATDPHANIMRVLKEVGATVPKGVLLRELKTRKMVAKDEAAIYEQMIESIYKAPISKVNAKAARLMVESVVAMFEGRQIIYGIRDVAQNIKSVSLEETKKKLKELGAGVVMDEDIETGDYLRGFEQRYEKVLAKRDKRDRGEAVGIPTGIRQFDAMIGGLMDSEFGVIAGQPGVGKSATLVSFGLNAWRQGYNVLWVTGEMPKIDVEFRADADVAGISASKFRLGNFSDGDLRRWKKEIEKQRDLHSNFLEVVSFPRNFSASDIEGTALQIQDYYEDRIDLICLDYLNIMGPNKDVKGDHWRSQFDVVWEVKSLCAELNDGIGLWTANQVTDEGVNAQVLNLSHLKYARAISEAAPVVIGLVKNWDEEAEMVLELQVLKMRNAELPNQSIILHPNMEYMRIHEEILPTSKDLLKIETNLKRMPEPQRGGRR